MAALSTIAAVSAIAASAFSVGKAAFTKAPKAPPPPKVPDAPKVDQADLNERKRAAAELQRTRSIGSRGRNDTILTSGQGVKAPAQTERKTLLGM